MAELFGAVWPTTDLAPQEMFHQRASDAATSSEPLPYRVSLVGP